MKYYIFFFKMNATSQLKLQHHFDADIIKRNSYQKLSVYNFVILMLTYKLIYLLLQKMCKG